MPWLLLLVSGLLEVAWASLLPATRGFTRPGASILVLVLLVASVGMLSVVARSLPVGTAYAVWVGIGAAGTLLVGILARGEPATVERLGFALLLVVAIAGLKLTTTTH